MWGFFLIMNRSRYYETTTVCGIHFAEFMVAMANGDFESPNDANKVMLRENPKHDEVVEFVRVTAHLTRLIF